MVCPVHTVEQTRGKREEETGLEVSGEGNNFDMLSLYLCRKLLERGWGKTRKTQTKTNNMRVYDLGASFKYMLMVFLLGVTKIKSGYQSGSPGWT